METDKLNQQQEILPYTGEPIPRLDIMGDAEWDDAHHRADSLGRVAWLIAGFNIGFVAVMAGLLTLSVLVPNFDISRAKSGNSDNGTSGQEVRIVPNSDEQTALAFQPSATPTLSAPSVEPTSTPSVTATPNRKATARANVAATNQAGMLLTPSATPTAIPSSTPIPPTATPLPPPTSYALEGIRFFKQGWNNCGPANLAMGLSFYNWQGGQNDTAAWLKPNNEDKNVTAQQMVEYVNQFTNLRAIWRMAGTIEQIQWLIANNFVVIVESGYTPAGENWYGHFETVVSYDNSRSVITVYDSYLGSASRPSVTYSESVFDRQWQTFNRNYLVIYPPNREGELRDFLGPDWVDRSNRAKAVQIAQQEAADEPNNAYAWFNLGTSLTSIGRYDEAVVAFQRAFDIGLPYRMLWYQFAPYEAYLQSGRFEDAITLANNTLRTTRYVEETYYYKGRVYETRGDYQSALIEYQNAVTFNPNHSQAQAALRRVESYQ